jgi:hypothetical protein
MSHVIFNPYRHFQSISFNRVQKKDTWQHGDIGEGGEHSHTHKRSKKRN